MRDRTMWKSQWKGILAMEVIRNEQKRVFVGEADQPGEHILGRSGNKIEQEKSKIQPLFVFQKGNGLHSFGRNK